MVTLAVAITGTKYADGFPRVLPMKILTTPDPARIALVGGLGGLQFSASWSSIFLGEAFGKAVPQDNHVDHVPVHGTICSSVKNSAYSERYTNSARNVF